MTDTSPPEPDPAARPPRRSSRPGVLLATALALVSFVLSAGWLQTGERRERFEGRRADLAALVAARQERAAALQSDLRELRAEVSRLAGGDGGGELGRLRDATARLARAAGLSPMTGPGVAVELSDSTLAKRGDPQSADFQIQDVDLQSVVNELWSAGAEAIAVNDQRAVATTAIRNAGGAVLVNYDVLSSPYRVVAIGDRSRLRARFERSHAAAQFRRWSDIYRLGFKVSDSGDLSVPGFVGSLQFRYARPIRDRDDAGEAR